MAMRIKHLYIKSYLETLNVYTYIPRRWMKMAGNVWLQIRSYYFEKNCLCISFWQNKNGYTYSGFSIL